MGIVESTIAFLFRRKAPVVQNDAQRTAAILNPIFDQAADVAKCLIDQKADANDTANDTANDAATDR